MGMAAAGLPCADGPAGTPAGGSAAFAGLSPTLLAATRLTRAAAAALPPVLLVHGRQDSTVPCAESVLLGRALKAAGAGQARVTGEGPPRVAVITFPMV